MKRCNRSALTLAFTLAALTALPRTWGEENKTEPATPPQQVEAEHVKGAVTEMLKTFTARAERPAFGYDVVTRTNLPKIKAAYMGVTTKAADATLRKQLRLPEGVGLVVTYLDKDGPTKAAGLELHDVLHKFDDQILINERQLLTLVRMHKPGDKIEVTAIHEGKEKKSTVTLAEKEVPPLEAFDETGMAPAAGEPFTLPLNGPPPPMAAGMRMNPIWTKALAFSDPEVSVRVETKDGDAHLVAKDKDGNVLFEGPANAEAKIPPLVLKHLGEAVNWTDRMVDKDVIFQMKVPPPGAVFRYKQSNGDAADQ